MQIEYTLHAYEVTEAIEQYVRAREPVATKGKVFKVEMGGQVPIVKVKVSEPAGNPMDR
jgi:hypothetical protein